MTRRHIDRFGRQAVLLATALMAATPVSAQAPGSPDPPVGEPIAVATYDFEGASLEANEVDAPALEAIDPLAMNAFESAQVCGRSKEVYRFDGRNVRASEQGGLALSTRTILTTGAYTIDVVFLFDGDGRDWERILDASDRTSDDGLYVDPGGGLQVYPARGGPRAWTFDEYHRVTVATDGSGKAAVWLDGALQLERNTTSMDLDGYANPGRTLTFFSDNVRGGATTEWVPGKVSLIRVFDRALTSDDVQAIGAGFDCGAATARMPGLDGPAVAR